MSDRAVALGRRFARVATRAVVARPRLWPLFRPLLRRQFDSLASSWEGRRGPESLAAVSTALARLDGAPSRILDVGTGTGLAARLLADRYPQATVVGVDLAPAMVEEARRLTDDPRITFEVADASALPLEPASFELVVLLNMIPFFDELARVTAPGGALLIAFSSGPATPIHVPHEALRDELRRRGFRRFDEVTAGPGTALIARR